MFFLEHAIIRVDKLDKLQRDEPHIHTLTGNDSMPYSCVTPGQIIFTHFIYLTPLLVRLFYSIQPYLNFLHHCFSVKCMYLKHKLIYSTIITYCRILYYRDFLTYRWALSSNSSTRSDSTNMALKHNFNIELYFSVFHSILTGAYIW